MPAWTLVGAAACALQATPVTASSEATSYSVDFLPTRPGMIEVGGLDFLPDGRLVVSTRHGQVWIVTNPGATDPAAAKFDLFAEGLYEGLGLAVVQGEIYVLQRTELSRLRDTDGDGRCDTVDTICDDWGVSGNYHEFAYGLPHDRAGNFYVSLNVAFFDPKWWHGKSPVPHRGWILKIAPDGKVEPFASGFRSPNGLCLDGDGELFATDNQGDWMPSCPLVHVEEGGFYGHPASLEWTPEYRDFGRKASDTEPPQRPRQPPALWIPYGLSRSAGNPLWDSTGGKFGPFAGQMFVAELTNGCVVRADLEKVDGEYQGAVLPFRRDTGSANRIAFAPDGTTMFVGLTNRGWGGAPPADGIARIRYSGTPPMEMRHVHLEPDGFTIDFTLPLATTCRPEPASVRVALYDYNSWWEYGSPEVHVTAVDVTGVEVAADRQSLRLRAPGIQAGMVARVVLDGIVGVRGHYGQGEIVDPLLHPQFDYTVKRLPGGASAAPSVPVAKTVAPPPTREDLAEGWVTLFNRRSLAAFDAAGWRLAAVHQDPADPTRFAEHPLVDDWDGLLVNGPGAGHAVSRFDHGDCEAQIEFCVPQGSNSGVYFMGRYELQILDSFGKPEVGYGDCGGIYEGRDGTPGFAGSAPQVNASNAPGEWQRFDVRFRAPRFDAAGRKVANAKFEWVKLNGRVIQQDVEVPNPTRSALGDDEVPFGPLLLQGDHGPVAFKKVRLRPLADDSDAANGGFVRIFDGQTLAGWSTTGSAQWSVEEGAIVGRGGKGRLVSVRGDYRNVEQRARVRISEEGHAGFCVRAASAAANPEDDDGYDARIDTSRLDPAHPDVARTGSLAGLAPVTAALLPANVWFDYRVRCVDEAGGTHVQIWVDGLRTVDFVDRARRHAAGHLVLQLQDGAEIRFQDVEVRELP